MKTYQFKIIIFIIFIISFSFSKETLGLVTKSKGKVEYKNFSEDNFTKDVYRGLGLYGDDRIRTGDNGFSIYRYLDDASSIKILKNSDVEIQGRVDTRNIVKQVEVNNGILNFNIDKQNVSDFTIVTPTSIATVKGTDFWLICNGPEGDRFFGVEGDVEIKNIESGSIVILQENSVVISNSDGNILTQNMSSQDLEQIENLNEESGEYEDSDIDTGLDDSINEELDDSADSDEENIIRLEFEDSFGNSKEIIIKYK